VGGFEFTRRNMTPTILRKKLDVTADRLTLPAAKAADNAGCTPRDLNPRTGPTGRCRSWLIAPGRATACKNLQDVPEQASMIGIDWRSGGRADPDFPGFGCDVLARASSSLQRRVERALK
jgi:hypothetical protein